MTFLIK